MIRMIQYEFGKILNRKIVYAGLLALLIGGILLFTGSGPTGEVAMLPDGRYIFGSEAISYNQQIAKAYEGVLTEETIQEILEEFAPGTPDGGFWDINTSYNTMVRYWGEMDGSYNGAGVREAFPDYTDERDLVYGYNRGYMNYLFLGSSIMVGIGFLLIIALSPVYAEEYDRKMDALILTSRYGKRQCALAKAAASYLFTLLVTGLTLLAMTLAFLESYGLSGGGSSIQVNGRHYFIHVPYFLSCLQAAGFSLLLWFAGALILTGAILVLSSLCRTAFLTLVASLAFYMLPMLLEEFPIPKAILSLTPFWSFLLEKALEVPKLFAGSGSGFSYVWVIGIFALASSGLSLRFSRRIFARHQVS